MRMDAVCHFGRGGVTERTGWIAGEKRERGELNLFTRYFR
ncbi:hypothetical protein H206_05133 [Candidatus Electrothrix aarhusensis]|uniref:Uncharacterized protein n=1 Tax=Candidatus Electrothrix aarhusensis TaxID=1859131 RepID=A0A444J5D4_9BACT|nr:hypothetical protein H206_05133 [Candidatus Electrothrix aarhusensis]